MEESYITLEDSSFGLNFREVSKAIILNLFWVGFHGIAHRILCSLYKSFTSDVIKLSQKKWISDSKSFSVYTFMKLHKRGKFYKYSICACYVKNFQSFTYRFSIQEIAILGRFLGPYVPIWSNIAEILTRGSTVADKNKFWKYFEGFDCLLKWDGPKVSTFGPTLTHLYLLKMANIEKNKQ